MNCLWTDPTTEKEIPVIDCAGYRKAEKLFLIVWRMDSEQDEIKIPIKVDKANIIYGLADIGICSIFENNLSVKIREKYNALIIEC